VLDPVFIDRSKPRAAFARALLRKKPRALRLNRAEFETLSGGRTDDAALARFAKARRTVIGLTGERDLVRDAERSAMVDNGDLLMSRVTAMGCAASALVGACLAVENDAWAATAAALILIGVAGELAAEQAKGPGSFAVAIIDAIHGIDPAALIARAKVS
jgi:hydroxyethylthiazole kinase